MATSPPKPCSVCGVLVKTGAARCDQHQSAWVKRKPTKRVTGRRLQAMRHALFTRDPLCAECRRQGRVRVAVQRDHVIPLAEGGADDASNEQGLCRECHEAKSQAEAQRGRAGGASKV